VSRGLANHRLYLAALVLDAWRSALARESVPALVLDQAFAPAVREHLLFAYGSFLLAITQPDAAPSASPPRCCAELPAPAPGKALGGEVAEFRQLEQQGWLAELLVPLPALPAESGRSVGGNLLAPRAEFPDCETCTQWHTSLAALMDRMSDSLAEC
jgi:hypothetical protein